MASYQTIEAMIEANPEQYEGEIGELRLRRLKPYLGMRRGEAPPRGKPPPKYQIPARDPIIEESYLNPIPIHNDSFLLKAMPPKASGKTKKRKKRKPRKKGKSHKKKKISRRTKK
jgi:hypothetical protein